jgi:hypothetical protein
VLPAEGEAVSIDTTPSLVRAAEDLARSATTLAQRLAAVPVADAEARHRIERARHEARALIASAYLNTGARR